MKRLKYILLVTTSPLLLISCLKEYDNPAKGTLSDKAAIYVVRDAYRGSDLILDANKLAGASFTSGTVISDKAAGNIQPGTFVIQNTTPTSSQIEDVTRGIVIDMGNGVDVPYVSGDSVVINVNGASLRRINGKLTITGITADKITKVADGKTAFIRPVTLAMLQADFNNYESTLVSVHADVSDYGSAVTYAGERPLSDNTATAFLSTRNEAGFSGNNVPVNAKFTGIAGYKNDTGNDTSGAKKIIALRNNNDVSFASGALYAGFPESFEFPDAAEKASYNVTATANNIDLATGNWKLQQAIFGNTVIRDKFNQPGKQCIRLQQNLSSSGYVQMNFDVTEGASKVTVFYGKYYTDPRSTFRLEYSVNGGTSWIALTPDINDMPERGSNQATFMVNISGNVRFRINKRGLGTSSATIQNGRLCIEDMAVYKKI